MNTRQIVIASIVLFNLLLCVGPSSGCLKKLKGLMRNKGKEEKPAELIREESSFISYSHSQTSKFYIEIDPSVINQTFIVRELDRPPTVMNQVTEFGEKSIHNDELEPDAEFLNTTTSKPSNDNELQEMSTSQKPPEDGNPEEEEEILGPEDQIVRNEWGGECTTVHWNHCNKIRHIVVLNVINTPFHHADLKLNCTDEIILCLRNAWTATRCHILCMAARCNKTLFFTWDQIVDFEGPCKYR